MPTPKGGGALRSVGESAAVNPATGALFAEIPIETSPGRSGADLGLELRYDSASGNGPFGIGWSLSVGAISRRTDKRIPRYDESTDSFLLSGSDELVRVQYTRSDNTDVDEELLNESGVDYRVRRYRPRIDSDLARIEWWIAAPGDSHWRVYTRDNNLQVYGRSAAARICDPESPSRVFSWLLEEVRDDRGNAARYSYRAEDGSGVDPERASEAHRFTTAADGTPMLAANAQRYLHRIQYGNRTQLADRHAPLPAADDAYLFEVVFDYGDLAVPDSWSAAEAPDPDRAPGQSWPARCDPFSSYRPGFELRSYRLCRRVLMFHRFAELGAGRHLVSSTDLEYEAGRVVSFLARVTQCGYVRDPADATKYRRACIAPLDLGYTKYEPDRNDNLVLARGPGLNTAALESAIWADLDGRGIAGLLSATEQAWQFHRNLGSGEFAAPAVLDTVPRAPFENAQLVDLGADGNLDLVVFGSPSGYFERRQSADWGPFVALENTPRIDWDDPDLRFIDLDGDGRPDILISKANAFVWHPSLGKSGFGAAVAVTRSRDERDAPAMVSSGPTESIHLADMTGDGLADLVRVRNGEVCYWPNLGYGAFGRRVILDNSPVFAAAAVFDPERVRFADLDGSGTSDVVYLGRDGVTLYTNQSGNAFAEGQKLASLPSVHALASVQIADVLGSGTASLVWSSALAADTPLAYVTPAGSSKPYLLERLVNNRGAETRVSYTSSTRFALADDARGAPWLTRLPFPVQVVERIERVDAVSGTQLTTSYAYHHGYFDGEEREFGGFAFVEEIAAESLGSDLDPPPLRTATWFHTGAWLDRERLEVALAREYYAGDTARVLLPDTVLPAGLSRREEREATRALRGAMLRQETYALDGTELQPHPYAVTERDYEVHLARAADGDGHAVFLVHPSNRIDTTYERDPRDPRVEQEIVLAVDALCNPLEVARIAYRRRSATEPEQHRTWITLTTRAFANTTNQPDWYCVGVPVETATSELTGVDVAPAEVLSPDPLRDMVATAAEIPFEARSTPGIVQRRVLARTREYYCADDLTRLPFGIISSRGLPFESYKQAFTPGLIGAEYGGRVDPVLVRSAGYVDLLGDGAWWAPSGRLIFDAAKFYQPVGFVDPFSQTSSVRYDAYSLLVEQAEDPLHSTVAAANDYRVLGPALVTDANANQTAFARDVLGVVVAVAFMGKAGAVQGDTLADPTVRVDYDPLRWLTSGGAQPCYVHSATRDLHGAANQRWRETYVYEDGFGREVMTKLRVEPGPVFVVDPAGKVVVGPDGQPQTAVAGERWVGTGRTVFDSHGNAIKVYEPFFAATHEFEVASELATWGVTPIFRYDAPGRLVQIEQPDGTMKRTAIAAWSVIYHDENDAVLGTPWLARKHAGTAAEKRCASLTSAHANTPAVAHLDPLGREFLQVLDNGAAGTRPTRTEYDARGVALSVTDPRGNAIERTSYDMLGRTVRVIRADRSPDGARAFLDVADQPIRTWDERGRGTRYVYDELRRPTHGFAIDEAGAERLATASVYGESLGVEESQTRNLRTRVVESYDGAGVVRTLEVDFMGNVGASMRRVTKLVTASPPAGWNPYVPDWSLALGADADPLLEDGYTTAVTYDAGGRPLSCTTPDGATTQRAYDIAGSIQRIDMSDSQGLVRTVVASAEYNARGQRTRVACGGTAGAPATTTTYTYDLQTFRLVRQQVVRTADGRAVQDLAYEYDAVGNVVQTTDRVSLGRGPNAPIVDPAAAVAERLAASYGDGAFVYDATYQLIEAQGRHHPGQQPDDADGELAPFSDPNDAQALAPYVELYDYDPAGNLLSIANRTAGAGPAWTRRYVYAADSNRLLATSLPGDSGTTASARYSYDAAGSMVAMPHLPEMSWDERDRLVHVRRQAQANPGTPNDVYFIYDASGARIRKVYEHGALLEERVYLGNLEIYRQRKRTDASIELERQTLAVVDAGDTIVLVETATIDASNPGFMPAARDRWQLANLVGSSSIELDVAGRIISVEEYYPFGASSFRATSTASEVSAKRYRYLGRERDEETGLVACAARYYIPWLGRWCSCDPAGLVDGTNLYRYARNSPITLSDPSGTDSEQHEVFLPHAFSGNESLEDVHAFARSQGWDFSGSALWDAKTRTWNVGELHRIDDGDGASAAIAPRGETEPEGAATKSGSTAEPTTTESDALHAGASVASGAAPGVEGTLWQLPAWLRGKKLSRWFFENTVVNHPGADRVNHVSQTAQELKTISRSAKPSSIRSAVQKGARQILTKLDPTLRGYAKTVVANFPSGTGQAQQALARSALANNARYANVAVRTSTGLPLSSLLARNLLRGLGVVGGAAAVWMLYRDLSTGHLWDAVGSGSAVLSSGGALLASILSLTAAGAPLWLMPAAAALGVFSILLAVGTLFARWGSTRSE